jgi:SAM-dependent methyltransferase
MKLLYLKGFKQRIFRTLGNRSLKDCSFLDIGCANGEYLWTAKSIGFGVVAGVEIDSSAANRASIYGEVKGDVSKFPKSSFDVVQIKNVLSNIPDFISFMNSSLRVLKPDGVLLLDVLNQDSFTLLLRQLLMRNYESTTRYGYLRPPYVINAFNKASLIELLRRLDLTPTWISTSYAGSPLLPYYYYSVPNTLGLVGSVVGKGSFVVAEAKKSDCVAKTA